MFSWQHFLWLFLCLVAIILIQIPYGKKRPPIKTVLNLCLGVCLFSEVSKLLSVIELVPSANGELLLPYLPLNHLPLHFCSVQILAILYARLTRNEHRRQTVLAFISSTGIIGAVAAMLMPSIFTTTVSPDQAFVSLVSYQFFVYHSMLIALGIIILRSGEVKWQRSHFVKTLLAVYGLGFASFYLNSVFASPTYADGKLVSVDFWTNFFFTYQTPIGLALTELWQWYLYLAVLALLAAVLLFCFFYPLAFRKRKGKRAPDFNTKGNET